MKIYSWNVNGLRSVIKKGDFQKFIAKHKPDILCLQETKAEQEQVEVDLPDYEEYWNSASTKGYSGTAIFSRSMPLKVTNGFSAAINKKYKLVDSEGRDSADEGRVITAEFEKFYVVSVYTPNAKDDLSRLPLREKAWDPAFLAHCKALEKKKPVVFCGDLNVAHTELDLANPKTNVGNKGFTHEERAGFQAFVDAGFVDTLRLFEKGNGHYSWWSLRANCRARNVGWRIDYVLVSKALAKEVKAAAIHADVMGSDHCPVSITLAGDAAPKAPRAKSKSAPLAPSTLVNDLRRVIMDAVPKAKESVKWNSPSFALAEHFATFNERSKVGLQLVLHLGAKPRPDADMPSIIGTKSKLLQWKSADRAVVVIKDAAHLAAVRAELSKILKAWSKQVR